MATYDVTVTVKDQQLNSVNSTVAINEVAAEPRPIVGMDANPTNWTTTVSTFDGIRYTREFGDDTADADTLPELRGHTSGKNVGAPANCIIHHSWKDDVEQLSSWMDGLARSIYLSWYHEPMGNVTPATYRATAGRITEILLNHPKKALVLGHGPIVTRYWLDENNGNPTDWGYTGMTHYGIDCYNGWSTAYRTPAQMFTTALTKVRNAYPGIKIWIPEYGMERITTDTTGSGRAAAMRSHMDFLRQPTNSDVVAIAWWNIGGDEITSLEPEKSEWREILSEQ
jgi:hypothetical protein